jgi:hypothetical protein
VPKFHENQKVEVLRDGYSDGSLKTHGRQWRNAKIVKVDTQNDILVVFEDGSHAIVDTDHIRTRALVI